MSDLLTVALLVALEGFLSVDNAMVLAVLVLGLPKPQQRKALHYGLIGAFAFRGAATALAVYLIRLSWVKLVGAAYLVYLVLQHFGSGESAEERRTPAKAQPWLGLPAFWATVVKVELTDIVFAIDSILVGVAMSSKLWVVIAGGFLGIVMMRLLIGRMLTLVERFPPLVDGAFVIIAWVSAQLILKFLNLEGWLQFELPEWLYLGVIFAIFAVALAYGWLQDRRQRPRNTDDDPARLLLREEGEER
jgi:YkoY family integral membrane protein